MTSEIPPIPTTVQYPRRNFTGWFLLGLLFILAIAPNLLKPATTKEEGLEPAKLEIEVKDVMSEKASSALFPSTKRNLVSGELFDKVARNRFTDVVSAEIYGVLRFENGQAISDKDASILITGPHSKPAIYRVLTSPHLSPLEAETLSHQLLGKRFVDKLINVELFSKAGNQKPHRELLNSLRTSVFLRACAVALIIFGGLAAWLTVGSLKLRGLLVPAGLANLPVSLPTADLYGMKAAIFFGIYLVFLALGGISSHFGTVTSLIAGVLTVASFPLLVKNPWGGLRMSFNDLGIGRGRPWSLYLVFGIVAFFLEFPASMIMGRLGEWVFPNQTSIHPAEAILINSHDPLMIAGLLFLASVQAPLFEETLFRGILLPSVARLSGSLFTSILINGLLFASLHPQGLGAWLGLGTIAAASSILTYHTRSIGPSIVMHAVHNGFTLFFVLILS